MPRRTVLVSTALLIATAAACGPAVPPLGHTQPSPDRLARAVLDAIERRDASALQQLALDEREFREHVWPGLPAARPERNLPFSYVWGDLQQKSAASLQAVLAAHGGRRYELIGVSFEKGASSYPGCRIHRETALTVRTPDGNRQTLHLYGSTLEKDGAWKVFSYVSD